MLFTKLRAEILIGVLFVTSLGQFLGISHLFSRVIMESTELQQDPNILKPIRVAILTPYFPEIQGIAEWTHDFYKKGFQSVKECRSQRKFGKIPLCPVSIKIVQIITDNNFDNRKAVDEVVLKINRDEVEDYLAASQFVNQNFDILSIEHEFGQFGGPEVGGHLFPFLKRIRIPIHVAFHTILKNPPPAISVHFREVLKKSDVVSVFEEGLCSRIHKEFLRVPCRFIPHGHEPNPPSRSLVRKDFPHIFEGKRVILSAGLIGPGKGYHYMIRAMVEVSKMCPNSVYVIAGDLHPGVVSSYLSDLHKLTKELKLDQWVKFVGGRNLGKEELLDWYSQSEIIVSPHLDPQQTSSGSVNMGMGFGKAVVASQFSFVQDYMCQHRLDSGQRTSKNSGRMYNGRVPPCWTVPFTSKGEVQVEALSRTVSSLLLNSTLLKATGKAAKQRMKGSSWKNVALDHIQLYRDLKTQGKRSLPHESTIRTTEKPWIHSDQQWELFALMNLDLGGEQLERPFKDGLSVEDLALLFKLFEDGKISENTLFSFVKRFLRVMQVEGFKMYRWIPQGHPFVISPSTSESTRICSENGQFFFNNGLLAVMGDLSKGRFEHRASNPDLLFGWGVVYSTEILYQLKGELFRYYMDRPSKDLVFSGKLENDFAVFWFKDTIFAHGQTVGVILLSYKIPKGGQYVQVKTEIFPSEGFYLENVEITSKIFFENKKHPKPTQFHGLSQKNEQKRHLTPRVDGGVMFDSVTNEGESWHVWDEEFGEYPFIQNTVIPEKLRFVSYGTLQNSSKVSYIHYRYSKKVLVDHFVVEEKRLVLSRGTTDAFFSLKHNLFSEAYRGFDFSSVSSQTKNVTSLIHEIQVCPKTLENLKSWLL